MKYIITSNKGDYTSKLLSELRYVTDIKMLTANDLKYTLHDNEKVYLPSDTVYPLIRDKFDLRRQNIIDNFRNKYTFRENLSGLFPNFFYDKINLDDLINYRFDFNKNKKYVIKPLTGFMGAGASIICKDSSLRQVVINTKAQVSKYAKLYPNIFSTEIIIEEYITGGDEYAVDMYYDENGAPIIINIYCHPQAKRQEYLQMLYYTNKKIFDIYLHQFKNFFYMLNQKLQINDFPIHAEFKLDFNGNLVPIEFNPCRFGGMGLTDLTYYAFDFHPVKAFFNNFIPDWGFIWSKCQEENFCWILGYNAADLDMKNVTPDHDKFKQILPKPSKLLAYEELNHLENPGFALACLSFKQIDGIDNILNIEFNNCFKEKNY